MESGLGEQTRPKNHKKLIFIILASIMAILVAVIVILIIYDIHETKRLDATSVTLTEDLTIGFDEPAKVSSFIGDLQGSMVNDFEINMDTLGEQEITFEYINSRNKKRHYTFTINVVDNTAPLIYGSSTYTVPINYEGDLTELMLSADDLDDFPVRTIVGDYDLQKVGVYDLEYVIKDSSGNESRKAFTLEVVNPISSAGTVNSNTNNSAYYLPFAEVVQEYKTDQTKIGIDVSAWQGEINWQKVKAAGVEFVFIRLGYQVGSGGDYVLDRYFQQNITGARSVGLPVGVYFYSYADGIDEAKKQAEWVTEALSGYKIQLGVALDWEDWANFNSTNMSLYTINQVANTFLDIINQAGYDGLLYGSKNYLNLIWRADRYLSHHKVWLAQYYDHPTYEKRFHFWQMSSSGRVDGISGNVDIDIMYLD